MVTVFRLAADLSPFQVWDTELASRTCLQLGNCAPGYWSDNDDARHGYKAHMGLEGAIKEKLDFGSERCGMLRLSEFLFRQLYPDLIHQSANSPPPDKR